MVERLHEDEERRQIGRSIVGRIRREANDEYAYFSGREGEAVFATLYLTQRDVCLPEHLIGDDVLTDIHAMFAQVFSAVGDELLERIGRRERILLAVEPSYEDSTFSVLCTEERVLMLHWSKAWHFYWPGEDAMADDLGRIYEEAATRLRGGPERRHEP